MITLTISNTALLVAVLTVGFVAGAFLMMWRGAARRQEEEERRLSQGADDHRRWVDGLGEGDFVAVYGRPETEGGGCYLVCLKAFNSQRALIRILLQNGTWSDVQEVRPEVITAGTRLDSPAIASALAPLRRQLDDSAAMGLLVLDGGADEPA